MTLQEAVARVHEDPTETGGPMRFNRMLDACSGSDLNEHFIESKLAELRSSDIAGSLYWLTFARICELALFCAGNYADAGELKACGDLMVNPRRIAIHIKDRPQPVIKPRHTPFSETLGSNGLTPAMRDAYLLAVEKKPLLTVILEGMAESEVFVSSYLQSVFDRMCRIADTLGFLAAYHCTDSVDFHRKLQQASEAERQYIRSRMCRFDLNLFHALGRDIRGLSASSRCRSRFLRPEPAARGSHRPIALNVYRNTPSTHSAPPDTGAQRTPRPLA